MGATYLEAEVEYKGDGSSEVEARVADHFREDDARRRAYLDRELNVMAICQRCRNALAREFPDAQPFVASATEKTPSPEAAIRARQARLTPTHALKRLPVRRGGRP